MPMMPKPPPQVYVIPMGSNFDQMDLKEGASVQERGKHKKNDINYDLLKKKGKMGIEDYRKEFRISEALGSQTLSALNNTEKDRKMLMS